MAPAFAISPDEVVERLSRHFAEHGEGLVCAYLFGSFARGTPRAGSDVDVAVLHDREPGPTLAESKTGIESRLEAATGLPADVVVLDTAPVELVHRLLRDGVLIHEADRSRRVRFEVRARNEYFDLKPILDQYRRAPGSPLVDRDLVLKKLAFVETCVRELRSLANLDASEHDVREERFVVHTLQLAIQAVLDAALRVVSDERLGEPQTNRELFDLLARSGWLPEALARAMRDMAGFRNVVVHGYARVDLRVVRDVAAHRLDDLLAFAAELRARVGTSH